jgi:hypothetical protein
MDNGDHEFIVQDLEDAKMPFTFDSITEEIG